MSIRAVGWLGSKLGIDIGGRTAETDAPGGSDSFAHSDSGGFAPASRSPSHGDPFVSSSVHASHVEGDLHLDEASPNFGRENGQKDGRFRNMLGQWEGRLDQVWRQANEKATRFWQTNVRSGGGANTDADLFGFGSANNSNYSNNANSFGGDHNELDENGLPLTKNWYYYDTQLGRWTVSADAPAHVQQEYYQQLEEAERERLAPRTAVAPPPPPPGGAALSMPSSMSGQRGSGSGLFAAGGTRGGHGPQYAIPNYFGAAPAPAQGNPYPPPRQSPPAPYGSASPYGQVSGLTPPVPPPPQQQHTSPYPTSGSLRQPNLTQQPAPAAPPAAPAASYPYSAYPPPPQEQQQQQSPYPAYTPGSSSSPPPRPSSAYQPASPPPPPPGPPAMSGPAPISMSAPGPHRPSAISPVAAPVTATATAPTYPSNGNSTSPGQQQQPNTTHSPYPRPSLPGVSSNSTSALNAGSRSSSSSLGPAIATTNTATIPVSQPYPPPLQQAYRPVPQNPFAHSSSPMPAIYTPSINAVTPPHPPSSSFSQGAPQPSGSSGNSYPSLSPVLQPPTMGLPPPPSFKPFTPS